MTILYRGVVGGGGGQVELELYPSDPSVVSRHVVDLQTSRHGPHTHIGVLVSGHKVRGPEVHRRDEVTVSLARMLRLVWSQCTDLYVAPHPQVVVRHKVVEDNSSVEASRRLEEERGNIIRTD